MNKRYKRIIDDSLNPTYTNPNIGAIVGAAKRGPVGPKHVAGLKARVQLYGISDPTFGYMLDSADAALMEMTELWVNRVVANDSKYALGLISNNVLAGNTIGTSFTSIPSGSTVPYDQVNRHVLDVEFNGNITTGNTAKLTINAVDTAVVTYATSHSATIAALRQAIQTRLDAIGAGGLAWIVPGTNDRVIRLISPQAITLSATATLTGSGAPTATVEEADWLAFVVAENQGTWAEKVAAGIGAVDTGIPQRITVSLSAALITGNTFAMTINGQTISAAFATDNNTTLTAFANAYKAAFPTGDAIVVNANAGASGNRKIILVAPDASTLFDVTAQSVTGGTSQASVTYAVTLNNTPSTGAFSFVVYENTSFASPDEILTCTFEDGIDGLGNPTGFEYVVNEGPKKSPRVRVKINPFFSGSVKGITGVTNSNYERFLSGGADGSLPSTQQVVTGWDEFASPEKVAIRILINAGYTTPEVHQKMIRIASNRMDCFAILDTPSDKQESQDAADYRRNYMNVDSFWGAIYSPDVLIYDQNMGRRRYIPPSGLVAAQYAYTDKTAAEWFAPAGLTRGKLQGALELRVRYEEGDRDLLSSAQVNAIRKYGSSFPIWGEYTLQQVMSALQSVPVVRLMIMIMTQAADIVAYSVFEPNNAFTWHRIRVRLNAILDPIQQAGGLVDHFVQCDEKTNTPDIIDQRVCHVIMWIKPTLSILYIRLDGVVTRQSANFTYGFEANINI